MPPRLKKKATTKQQKLIRAARLNSAASQALATITTAQPALGDVAGGLAEDA